MAIPSPPKPWERAGAGASYSGISTTNSSSAPASTPNTSSTAAAPELPARPASLDSVVNRTASNYAGAPGYSAASRFGTSPYGGYGGMSSYSSPYSRLGGGYGGMGGYGSMYGAGGYGGYGGAGMYGGGGYGGYGMPGMMGPPGQEQSLTQSFSQSTQATFQIIESIVGAFGGFAQMLESTYMATHSSFFAMVSVAEQFGNLRNTLGSVLGIFAIIRWAKSLLAKLTGRPPPASSTDLTPAKFHQFSGRAPDGSPAPPKASKKPFIIFLVTAFGLPYLMGKLIRSLAASQEAAALATQQQEREALDPSKLDFCRVLYDFIPEGAQDLHSTNQQQQQQKGVQGVDLAVRKGDLVAVLSKTDPLGGPSEWWLCRARDGRRGYLPRPYLEVITRTGSGGGGGALGPAGTRPAGPQRPQSQIEAPAPPGQSRVRTMTSEVADFAPGDGQQGMVDREKDLVRARAREERPVVQGKMGDIGVEGFQRSWMNSS